MIGKLGISDIAITKRKLFTKILKSKGPRIESWGIPQTMSYQTISYRTIHTKLYHTKLYHTKLYHTKLYHTKSYINTLFWFLAYGEEDIRESVTIPSYQFHNIPNWLLVHNHIFSINILKLYPVGFWKTV